VLAVNVPQRFFQLSNLAPFMHHLLLHMTVFYARTEREGALAIHNYAASWQERSIAWLPFPAFSSGGRPDIQKPDWMRLTT
jgi:hypothetical protein